MITVGDVDQLRDDPHLPASPADTALHYVCHIELASDLADVRAEGGEVAMPILASTVTTVVVFLPIFFVVGIAKLLFVPLVFTIAIALSCEPRKLTRKEFRGADGSTRRSAGIVIHAPVPSWPLSPNSGKIA